MKLPSMPFAVEVLPFGPTGHQYERPVKVYPNGTRGDVLSPEEVATVEYVRHLEAERDRLTTEVEQLTAPKQVDGKTDPKAKGK